MYGLRIHNPTLWRDDWSATIGQRLQILNSTYNLFVFGEKAGIREIRAAISEIPPEAYELIKIHPSTTGLCEIVTDDGQCFELEH